MSRTVECFYPGHGFPAISVTGDKCALECKHCRRKYLDGMIPATKPDDLVAVAEALAERGAKGFLLSGGSDTSGRVPVSDFADAILEIKGTTDLSVNVHVGLTKRADLAKLVRAGVDAFSTDLYGDVDTIRDVLGIAATPDDYLQVVKDLASLGAERIAPHICVGIRGGRLSGEMHAIEKMRPLQPSALILISLIPTKGTAFADVRPPDKGMLTQVVGTARQLLPETKLMLGCMRSKIDRSMEIDIIQAGIDGIVLPASSTVEALKKNGYSIRKRATCCAMV